MARVTIEDCLVHEENPFALVLLASRRARQLMKGAQPLVHSKNREAVSALREIADNKVHFAQNTREIVSEFIEENRRRDLARSRG